ncbi:MAG: hypothetical protein IPK11_12785 [Ignavibacteria bacterium]|nr:hypothetical protein [Ignavibacteria bacterium]
MKKILFLYVMLAGMTTLYVDEMNIRRLNFSDILAPPQKSAAARPLAIQVPYRTLYLDAADVHKAFLPRQIILSSIISLLRRNSILPYIYAAKRQQSLILQHDGIWAMVALSRLLHCRCTQDLMKKIQNQK